MQNDENVKNVKEGREEGRRRKEKVAQEGREAFSLRAPISAPITTPILVPFGGLTCDPVAVSIVC